MQSSRQVIVYAAFFCLSQALRGGLTLSAVVLCTAWAYQERPLHWHLPVTTLGNLWFDITSRSTLTLELYGALYGATM